MSNNFFDISKANFLMAVAVGMFATSCGNADFKIKGEIYGADNQSVVLEKSDFHGRWIAIDSTRTSSTGAFSISRPSPAAPEVFRLSVGDKFLYVPIDSTETITVTSSLEKFGSEFTLTGSQKAETLEKFEKDVMALPAGISQDSLNAFKRQVYAKYLMNSQGSVVSYYILTKYIGNTPLFDPTNHEDVKYFAAVATGFQQERPDDPRTALLEQTSKDALRRKNSAIGKRLEIAAEELKVMEIDLPDENGVNKKLSDFVGKGKPTVVIFSLLTHPDSPALNLELSKIYKSRGGNINFYQVSLDPDQYAWRDAAKNLPWTTVFDPDGEYSNAARSYNVFNFPTFFIYSSAGELSDRAATINELRKKL
ncbi:MAG: hypothetical protein HDR88_13520 [Bacteroides sp.]|nr:hypothetical protein [Bacteroides sp.]